MLLHRVVQLVVHLHLWGNICLGDCEKIFFGLRCSPFLSAGLPYPHFWGINMPEESNESEGGTANMVDTNGAPSAMDEDGELDGRVHTGSIFEHRGVGVRRRDADAICKFYERGALHLLRCAAGSVRGFSPLYFPRALLP